MTRARRHLVIMSLNPKHSFILNFNSVRSWGFVHSTTRQQIFEGLADLARRERGCSLRGVGLTLAKIATPLRVLARRERGCSLRGVGLTLAKIATPLRVLARKYGRRKTGMYKGSHSTQFFEGDE